MLKITAGEMYTKYTDLNLFSPDNTIDYYSFGEIVCFHYQVILSNKNYLGKNKNSSATDLFSFMFG